jgi:SpoVK/Ycf46/Vps4 family AAA+-type ATPase
MNGRSPDGDREQLERRLVFEPMNLELRLTYGRLLQDAGEHEAAVQQLDIAATQASGSAIPLVAAARSLAQLRRGAEAIDRYARARGLADFRPDDQLEELMAAARRAAPVQLSTVPRDAASSDNVVPIEQARRARIRFDDVAGMEDLKRTIRLQIIEPFLRPGLFAKFKKRAGGGVLLYGPPGCGKTMTARAVAGECQAEFISVGISDVLSMWIGRSEENLALLFEKARASTPSVLFFDELDALAYSRSKANSEHTRQVVNEFLSQLDGFGADNQGVLILAATNMPWDVDSAMKRPGRFTRQIFVPPPDEVARATIVNLKLNGVPHENVDAAAISRATPHFSGADVEGLVELAKEYVIEDHITRGLERPIGQADLLRAVQYMRPSTLDWLRTARNLVKYAGADDAYRDVEDYLKRHKVV